MNNPTPFTKSASTTEISNIGSLAARPRAPTPRLEDRFPYSFKSLFTLADVAAKRRANGNIKKLAIKTDENTLAGGSPVLLKRSKSSGDVTVLGEKTQALNITSKFNHEGTVTTSKALRSRTLSPLPSKIPKAKSPFWLNINNFPLATLEEDPTPALDFEKPNAFKVDDALFVMVTPPKAAKILTLAAHTPSLPKIASPFSPRITQSSPSVRPISSRPSSRVSGHTNASLHLTKTHWESRYDAWLRSLRSYPPRDGNYTRSAVKLDEERPPRSRFPKPLTNPALFPRAGSLTPRALRPQLGGTVVDEDARSAIELDWAMRAWPLDKIQRALFLHDMDIRTWHALDSAPKDDHIDDDRAPDGWLSELNLMRGDPMAEESVEVTLSSKTTTRRWEWDWEMRWRVIEDLAKHGEDVGDRATESECNLADSEGDGNVAYAGCEMEEDTPKMGQEKGPWDWSEDAMEVDEILRR